MVRIRTGSHRWDDFPQRVAGFLAADLSRFPYDGETVRGYRSPDTKPIWIRDQTYQLQFARYVDAAADLWSPYEFFLRRQRPDNSFWEWVSPERPLKRIGVEADVEYLMVLGVEQVWQATGDDARMAQWLPVLESGLRYSMSHPDRWSPEHGLIKRAFTIDTWDFEYLGLENRNQPIRTSLGPHTRFGIMHGDNSGLYAAACALSRMNALLGRAESARRWTQTAEDVRERMNRLCWNGRYYRHFVHIDPCEVPDVDEEAILSLSNTFDITRGAASDKQALSILDEYARRGRELDPRPFAPWFTIQPCFPEGAFGNLGHVMGACQYINGGLMAFVGGELALGALERGRERFGVEQLRIYVDKISRSGQAYFCYRYDGEPDLYRNTMVPTDGWGSSAMAHALVRGLSGVQDAATLFRRVRLSPRWPADDEREAEVEVSYAHPDAHVRYRETVDPANGVLELDICCGATTASIQCHILLPQGVTPTSVAVNGQDTDFGCSRISECNYVDVTITGCNADVRVQFRPT